MKRRNFIQISSMSLAALLVDGCTGTEEFDVTFLNDMAVGHLAFESHSFPTSKILKTKYLIVGGGIAGMSAAYQLRHEDFMLFELSDLLGGSSAGSRYKNISLCHGAHYDLSYPSNYGREVLSMLEDLKSSSLINSQTPGNSLISDISFQKIAKARPLRMAVFEMMCWLMVKPKLHLLI